MTKGMTGMKQMCLVMGRGAWAAALRNGRGSCPTAFPFRFPGDIPTPEQVRVFLASYLGEMDGLPVFSPTGCPDDATPKRISLQRYLLNNGIRPKAQTRWWRTQAAFWYAIFELNRRTFRYWAPWGCDARWGWQRALHQVATQVSVFSFKQFGIWR